MQLQKESLDVHEIMQLYTKNKGKTLQDYTRVSPKNILLFSPPQLKGRNKKKNIKKFSSSLKIENHKTKKVLCNVNSMITKKNSHNVQYLRKDRSRM